MSRCHFDLARIWFDFIRVVVLLELVLFHKLSRHTLFFCCSGYQKLSFTGILQTAYAFWCCLIDV